jgi:uncharacterized repeat protein (TIGR01451 family)
MKKLLSILSVTILLISLTVLTLPVSASGTAALAPEVPASCEAGNDVLVGGAHGNVAVDLTVGDTLTVQLEYYFAFPLYEWIFTSNNTGVLELVSFEQIPTVPPLPGSGGVDVWTFQAVKAGTCELFFDSVPVGGGDPDQTLKVTVNVTAPQIVLEETAELANDADGDGAASPGDTLRYTARITNNGAGEAREVRFYSDPDSNTTLVAGSVTFTLPPVSTKSPAEETLGFPQGQVIKGNGEGDRSVEVYLGYIPPAGNATVNFDVTVNSPVYYSRIVNQGTVTGSNFPDVSDDFVTYIKATDPVHGPGLSTWGIIALAGVLGGAMVWVGKKKLKAQG